MQNLTPDDYLFYMFDIPQQYQDKSWIMLAYTRFRLEGIRNAFWKIDLNALNDYTVVKNIHSDYKLGIYIVHNLMVEHYINTDDFGVVFTIKEYNEAKTTNTLSTPFCSKTLLTKFAGDKWLKQSHYPLQSPHFLSGCELQTNWHIATYKDKAVALVSKKDSNRYFEIEDFYEKSEAIKVPNLESGIDFLKMFKP